MTKESTKNIITENLLFKDFNNEEIDILVKNSSFVSFDSGDFIVSARQDAKHFYFIINGSVSLQAFSHEHGVIELENIQDGEILGWSWLIPPYKYHFDAIILDKTRAIQFDAHALKIEMQNNHEFGYKIYKLIVPVIIERLQASRENILELYENNFVIPD